MRIKKSAVTVCIFILYICSSRADGIPLFKERDFGAILKFGHECVDLKSTIYSAGQVEQCRKYVPSHQHSSKLLQRPQNKQAFLTPFSRTHFGA